MNAEIGAVGIARRWIVIGEEFRLSRIVRVTCGEGLIASGFALPVAGSGFNASILSKKVRGICAKNIGVLIIVMCWSPPSASLNSNAMPLGIFSASDTSGFPPASEKRTMTGIVAPEKSAERE